MVRDSLLIGEIEEAVRQLRAEQVHVHFTSRLAHLVSLMGAVQDSPPERLTSGNMVRLRQLVQEAIDAIETRIDSGRDGQRVQRELVGTVYEITRRLEGVEAWANHFRSERVG